MTTYAEIQEQIKALQAKAEQMRAAELQGVIAEVKEKIRKYGLTAEQLGFSGARRGAGKKSAAKAEVMYRKGDLTWSGAARGRRPEWVKQIVDAGGDIEQYRVK